MKPSVWSSEPWKYGNIHGVPSGKLTKSMKVTMLQKNSQIHHKWSFSMISHVDITRGYWSPWNPTKNHHFPMVFLWFSYQRVPAMGSPWGMMGSSCNPFVQVDFNGTSQRTQTQRHLAAVAASVHCVVQRGTRTSNIYIYIDVFIYIYMCVCVCYLFINVYIYLCLYLYVQSKVTYTYICIIWMLYVLYSRAFFP